MEDTRAIAYVHKWPRSPSLQNEKQNQPQTPCLLASIPRQSCLLCCQWACIKCSDVSLIPSSYFTQLRVLHNILSFNFKESLLPFMNHVHFQESFNESTGESGPKCSSKQLLPQQAQGCIYLALVAQSNSKHTPLTLWEHMLTDIHSCVWTHER